MLLPALAADPNLAITARPGANLTYMVVQHERPLLGDPQTRRALSLAIDREAITRSLFSGRARPAGGLISPANWAHADLPVLPFDPVSARASSSQKPAPTMRT